MIKHKRLIISITAALILAAVIIIFIIIGINKPHCQGLVGSWRYDGAEYTGEYIYTFNPDGTGSYYQDGDTLHFTYEDQTGSFRALFSSFDFSTSTVYQISEDNRTLTIEDSLGEKIVYLCE